MLPVHSRPMPRKTAGPQVYPPRYFTGHITVTRNGKTTTRIRFGNCVQVPISDKECWLFPAMPGDPYYAAAADLAKFDGWKLVDIQYAISVFDQGKRGHRIEKFNHPFETDTVLTVHDTHLCIQTLNGDDLYKTYKINDVMDEVSSNDVPILQFIS